MKYQQGIGIAGLLIAGIAILAFLILMLGCAWNKPYWHKVDLQPTGEQRVMNEPCELQW